MDKVYKVGIIGGGISGVVTALQLAENGIETVLFEQKSSVVNGPPFCHLHAGGNLYPDISDEQCRLLMKQSIEMARLFPQSIDQRPTFISIPKSEKFEPGEIERRLKMLVSYYTELIEKEAANKILGNPEDYYKAYTKTDLEALIKLPSVKQLGSIDDWMRNTLKVIDWEKLKTPVFMVQEYGWNMFRLAAQAQLALNKSEYCELKTNTVVTDIKDVRNLNLDYNWEIYVNKEVYKVKYLVNSSGFKTGKFDESLQITTERLIEFKAAYISKWQDEPGLLPELIFHGERGTPNGMAQLTPYYGGYYQIHGMTHDITLFEGGLVKSNGNNKQPEFNEDILKKLTHGWETEEIRTRTKNAIDFVSRFVPKFKSANVGGPPLFGAQQVIGNDISLRVAEVSFPDKSYARSEIIKASSALTVANKILNQVQTESASNFKAKNTNRNNLIDSITKHEIDQVANEIAINRGFPDSLSQLMIERIEI